MSEGIESRRRLVADEIYEFVDFGRIVEDADGWTFEGDTMRRTVYLRDNSGESPSRIASCEIRFAAGSATAVGAHSIDSRGGVMLFDLDEDGIMDLIDGPAPAA